MREEFCRRYDSVIRAYLATRWRLPRTHEEVTEATQEVFLQCLREGGALERVDPNRPGGMRGYLYGITSRTASQFERQQARWKRDGTGRALEGDWIEADEATLSRAFDRAWASMLAREARREHRRMAEAGSERARLRLFCLEQRVYHGRWPREIAETVKLPAARVSELLHEAMGDYRAALLSVMASHHPNESERELEKRCEELGREL